MNFSRLMTDTVDFLRKDGTKVEGLKASVQTTKLFLEAGNLRVETGDFLYAACQMEA